MKKFFKIFAIVLVSLILLVVLAVFGFKGWDYFRHLDFYRSATPEMPMPGVSDGFVQQGFDYYERGDLFLASGYMNDDSASRVYVFNRDGESYYTLLKDGDGDDYTSHSGGVSYSGEYLYIAASKRIDVFRLSDILNPDKTEARRVGCYYCFDTYGFNASFCEVQEIDGKKYLFAGSFHDEIPYPTDPKFHLKTPAGEENRAPLFVFPEDKEHPLGFDFDHPVSIYSIPSCVQGIAFTDEGNIILSTSYGLATSVLYVHNMVLPLAYCNMAYAKGTFNMDIPLYYLDSLTLMDTLKAPPMSEEIVYLDGKIWIMNESASNKYIFGKLTSGNDLYALPYKEK